MKGLIKDDRCSRYQEDNNITKSFKTENVMICDSPNYNCWLQSFQ